MDERAWQRWTEIPLLVASLLYLAAYSWRVIADLSGEGRTIANIVILVTWGLFILDYLVRLSLAKHRRAWFRQNWVGWGSCSAASRSPVSSRRRSPRGCSSARRATTRMPSRRAAHRCGR